MKQDRQPVWRSAGPLLLLLAYVLPCAAAATQAAASYALPSEAHHLPRMGATRHCYGPARRPLLLVFCVLSCAAAAASNALPPELRCLPAEGKPQLCRVEHFMLLPGQRQDAWTPGSSDDPERRLLRAHFRTRGSSAPTVVLLVSMLSAGWP